MPVGKGFLSGGGTVHLGMLKFWVKVTLLSEFQSGFNYENEEHKKFLNNYIPHSSALLVTSKVES